MKYYNGTKLLSLKDINGNDPEIYICTANRTAGKTTYFSRLLVNRFYDRKEKFCLIYRFVNELSDVQEKFFKDIKALFFPDAVMTARRCARGAYVELSIDEKVCGYAVALNNADQLKKYSHVFSDVKRMLFDEFQSETGRYCNKEIEKFISLHTSVARGRGEQVRRVPVFMVGNPVTILNPYYLELGITERLKADTKFLRGPGFVLEQGFVDSAADAQKTSAFYQAFAKNKYAAYSAESVYLNDNDVFIEKPAGRSRYILTLRYNQKDFAVREYPDAGIIYCDDSSDDSFPVRISTTTEDHQVNTVMLSGRSPYIDAMRLYFTRGCFRFKNQICKAAVLSAFRF